jgi:hypothetical protein
MATLISSFLAFRYRRFKVSFQEEVKEKAAHVEKTGLPDAGKQ